MNLPNTLVLLVHLMISRFPFPLDNDHVPSAVGACCTFGEEKIKIGIGVDVAQNVRISKGNAAHRQKDCGRSTGSDNKRPLQEAQTRYQQRVAALEVKNYQMPLLHDDQRKMIATILAGNPQLGSGFLTAQFRDLQNLPDEEVESYLRQLLELIETSDLGDSLEDKE